MNKALLAGITGMKNHQVRMNVVGNNISNVNTTGYKGARVNFQDTLYQTIKGAGESTNPAQTGVGSVVGSIDSIMTSGGLQSTGRTLDLAINGNGFFKVMNPLDGKEYYTREGLFYIDKEGYVVNSNGYRLIGDLRTITTVKSSDANQVLKVEDLSANDTVATATGTKEYAVITPEETENETQTLTLQGTLSDGKAGSSYDFIISPVQIASIGTGDNYTLNADANTSLEDIGLVTGDVLEFNLSSAYTGEDTTYSFEVINALTQTVADLQQALAENTNGEIQMYFSQGGKEVPADELNGINKVAINLKTTELGPGVNLKVKNLNNPSFALNTTDNGVSGTGDDINTIVSMINEKSSSTGVIAENVNNCLKLSTQGKGENTILKVYGNAATLLGLPLSGTVDFPASTTGPANNARINPDLTDPGAKILTLQGTLADGTSGASYDFNINTASRADIDVGGEYTIAAGGNATLKDINPDFSDGDILKFTYTNSYTSENTSFEISINANETISWLQEQFVAKAKEKGLDQEVEMYFTNGGIEVDPSFLDCSGDEGIAFRTKDYGPGVSLEVKTTDSAGDSKLVFNGIQSGTGDDIDTIIEKINEQTSQTGVVASNTNSQLVLNTVGKGGTASLTVGGEAAYLLGLPVSATTSTSATVTGTEDYARVTKGEINEDSVKLILQGTSASGAQGAQVEIDIETATAADISAGVYTNDKNGDPISDLGDALMTDLGNIEEDDEIEISFVNNYKNTTGSFEIKVTDTDTVNDVMQAFNSYAEANNIDAEMYIDGNKIGFRTTDYGTGVTLSINTTDGVDAKNIFTGTGSELSTIETDGTYSENGTGDGIDEIIGKIRDVSAKAGVVATKFDNKLTLTTVGEGEDATLKITGEAAYYLGLPVSNDAFMAASTAANGENNLITESETENSSETLTLQGLLADGTVGQLTNINIETATAASIYAGEYDLDLIDPGNTNMVTDLGFDATDKIKVEYVDNTGNASSFEVSIGAGTVEDLKDAFDNAAGNNGYVTMEYTGHKIYFKTTESGSGVSLQVTTTDSSGALKNIFTGLNSDLANIETDGFYKIKGEGYDLNDIKDEINKYTDTSGVVAKISEDKLVLESVGRGENTTLTVGGSAAALLGLSTGIYTGTVNNDKPATTTGTEVFAYINGAETIEPTTTLTLLGVHEDGSVGSRSITIDTAEKATIVAFENKTIDADTDLLVDADIGFVAGDTIEFTIKDKYTGEIETFSIEVDNATTLASLKNDIATISNQKIEMYFTSDGEESVDLDGTGDEGVCFRAADYDPGISLSITTRDASGLVNRFNGTGFINGQAVDGGGDDIYEIAEKINTETTNTGVIAKIVNNRLVLETVGKGEDVSLDVGGDAASLLGFAPIKYQGVSHYAALSGSSEYESEFTDNQKPAGIYNGTSDKTATLTLRGTKYDGTNGEETDFTIDATEQAVINAGENYNIDANTKMSSLGFSEGDKIEFTIANSEESKKITMEVNNTQTLKDFQNALYAQASSQGLDNAIEMYYTSGGIEADFTSLDGNGDEGFGFRTADFGPNITLSIVVKDQNDNSKSMFDGTNSDFIVGAAEKSGTGDDIDSIISKINNETEVTGVIASKDADNRLVLRTSGDSEDATLFVDGDAASYLGLPSGVRNNEGVTVTSTLKLKGQGVSTLSIDGMGTINGTDNSGTAFEWEGGDAITDAGVAQIALYNFANQDGLLRVNNGMFLQSASTGREIKGDAGSNGFGTIESGNLEMSNVDLTEEFSNMIITQRGYQANARVVTVSDSMLEELLNLKR